MSFMETLSYIVFKNPVSTGVSDLVKSTGILKPKEISTIVETVQPKMVSVQAPLWKVIGHAGPFVRLAGISGASAVILGAYGAHKSYPEGKTDLRKIFETANRFHFFHTLALIGVPFCRNPKICGSLFILGMSLFCGTCYYRAFTGKNEFGKLAPVGGSCLILAWLAMIL